MKGEIALESYCKKCDKRYDRDRLSSLKILYRGSCLCGYPFTVSAIPSTELVNSEMPDIVFMSDESNRVWSEVLHGLNGDIYEDIHF